MHCNEPTNQPHYTYDNHTKCQPTTNTTITAGLDQGTCTPYAADGDVGGKLAEGPDEAQFVCVCAPGWKGVDCSEAAGCEDDGFPFCADADMFKKDSGKY